MTSPDTKALIERLERMVSAPVTHFHYQASVDTVAQAASELSRLLGEVEAAGLKWAEDIMAISRQRNDALDRAEAAEAQLEGLTLDLRKAQGQLALGVIQAEENRTYQHEVPKLRAQLEGLREAVAEMVDHNQFVIISGSPGPLYAAGWAAACKFFGEKASTALAAAQTGVKPEGRNHPNPPVPS